VPTQPEHRSSGHTNPPGPDPTSQHGPPEADPTPSDRYTAEQLAVRTALREERAWIASVPASAPGRARVSGAFGPTFGVDQTWQNKNRIFPVQGPDVTVNAIRRRGGGKRLTVHSADTGDRHHAGVVSVDRHEHRKVRMGQAQIDARIAAYPCAARSGFGCCRLVSPYGGEVCGAWVGRCSRGQVKSSSAHPPWTTATDFRQWCEEVASRRSWPEPATRSGSTATK
jgi:hypothetical protein